MIYQLAYALRGVSEEYQARASDRVFLTTQKQSQREMQMKRRIVASASGLALTLLVSAAWGQARGTILPTGLGVQPIQGVATVKGICPVGTTEFSKPQFPNFLSGPESGVVSGTYSVWDPDAQAFKDVTVTLTYYSDRERDRDLRNSFDFEITNGSVAKLVVKRSDGLLYVYDSPVSADTGLNKVKGGAPEISHVEFCLSAEEAEGLPPFTSSAQDCLEGIDEIPKGEIGEGGCNPSGYQLVELPNELSGALEGKTITQIAAPATNRTPGVCDGEFVSQDPRVDASGNVIANAPLDLSTVFDLSAFFDPPLAGRAILRADTVGSPCLALIVGKNNFEFADLISVLPNGGVYVYTQFPELIQGMNTLPQVGPLNTDPLSAFYQPDLQFVEQAAYQPDNRLLLVEQQASPFTFDVINPPRTGGFLGSFYPLNTREVCLYIDPTLVVGTKPYFQAVLQCKIDLAVEYFYNLEQALNNAEPNLISPSLNRLLRDHSRALSMIKTLQWDKATARLNDLLTQVVNGQWNVDEKNDPGNLIMRIWNLLWRTEQLEAAHAALLAMP
jgi:hypothetical protein